MEIANIMTLLISLLLIVNLIVGWKKRNSWKKTMTKELKQFYSEMKQKIEAFKTLCEREAKAKEFLNKHKDG